ncbi:uncharacterized protein LOC135436040 [Drosophila montana]|uniref:uncharacterized protein LOC135436040 n=1 Tax=Drosophila montana TaxID=40370 RepID=UPI00313B9592
MERFAFKIDAALKANLYKICRLCGIDNPSKVPILPNESDVIDLDEPSLSQKVFELIGFVVTQDDKMPQTMCSLCVDKINDFYEFREMCFATNNQTRKLLGLKDVDSQKILDVKPIFKTEPLTVATPAKRGRKRKTEDPALAAPSTSAKSTTMNIALDAVKNEPFNWRKKLRLQHQQLAPGKTEVKEEPTEVVKFTMPAKKARKASCSVCGERFKNKELVEEHKATTHVPTVLRYTCTACNQSHHSLSDIKAHQLWHKLSKTPYQCPLCDASVASNYAYTRHLREHTLPTPIELLVLDRECPLCRKTFLTNYFYNTHPCARRTRQCGGCSRLLNSEIAYMRHAPHCAKIYLNHSKHIMPEAADNEAQMRIKNENDVEADDNAHSSIEYTQAGDMQPVVVLERLASPLLRASSVSNSLGRSSDRVSSKKYLKRVDQLLKNTMSTLVSIKHEPEVHIDDTGPPLAFEQPESEPDEDPPACDDFHANAGYDDSDEDAASGSANAAGIAPSVSVKQEPFDESYEKQPMSSSDGVQIKQEPLKLKLKITKNHGQLNSSIVDDDDNEVLSKSAKKKKKRKHKERNKESEIGDKATQPATAPDESPTEETVEAAGSAIVSIKHERFDDNYAGDCVPQVEYEPQATVMTSIPMLQLGGSYSELNQQTPTAVAELEDVKPNRLELDRIMQITHIASGVVMAEEAMPPESAVEAVPNEGHVEKPTKPAKKTLTKSTARKSTGGGVPREVASTSNLTSAELQLPQIVAVESGASVPFNAAAIKPEPLNRGYADEQEWTEQGETEVEELGAEKSNEINHNEKIDEESAYINSLDLSNVIIKQEKDLHISDVDINGSEAGNIHYNGMHESEDSDEDDDDDASASSADEAEEENMDTYEEPEERIYREIELPPLEEESPIMNPAPEAQNASEILPVEPHSDMMTIEPQPETLSMETEGVVHSEILPVEPRSEMISEEAQIVVQEPTTSALENRNLAETQSKSETAQMEPQDMTHELEPALASEHNVVELQDESEVPQLAPESADTEPQQEPASAALFNFVITSVCSQAEEQSEQPLEGNNDAIVDNSPELSEPEATEKNTCPVVTLSAPKDNETLAQPFFASSSNYTCAEEQQNVLNHELSASVQMQQVNESNTEASATRACIEALAEDEGSANEETENRINEQQQQQQQQLEQVQQEQEQLQPPQQPRLAVNDDSNINEIAENNNNANIERELNDDANVAQENPIP